MPKKVKKSKGRGKPADRGGAVSQTDSPPSSALGWKGTGEGTREGYVPDVEEDEAEKSWDFDMI